MKGFYHIWAVRQSWSCDPDVENKLSFPYPGRLEKKMVEHVNDDGRRTDNDGWTPDHEYPINSPMSLWLR